MEDHQHLDDAPHLAEALLSDHGGGGAVLRGSVPEHPEGVVLVLHGGAETGTDPVSWWRLAVLRMAPFARAVERRSRGRLAVIRLKYRVRGWNGSRRDPIQDALWALERLRALLPSTPVVLVGHSMGGRVALEVAAHPSVAAVVALAPWVDGDVHRPRPGTPVLLLHGARDRVTDPRRTEVLARRYADSGIDVQHVEVPGETHALLRHAGFCHDTVAEFVTSQLAGSHGRGRTS